MANGFPVAAVCGRADIMNHFSTRPGGDTYFAGTFNGNVAGCAGALATMEILEREPVHHHIFRLGERLRVGLREILTRRRLKATVAGFGSIFVAYFMEGPIETYTDLLRNDATRFIEFRRKLIEHGIFMMPANLKRAHVSYSHTDAHVDKTLEACDSVLKKMFE
jgi:glutamate-1-semialdehyde 2,1-aminomutase